MNRDDVKISKHALQRLFVRGISVAEALSAVENGEVIKEYPEDVPWPSRLIAGYAGSRPIHVVVANDPISMMLILITVYEPDPGEWTDDFKRRRNR